MTGGENAQARLAGELASLASLTRRELQERWRLLYENEPPPHFSIPLLRGAVAYRLQEKALGGLKPATRRQLQKIAEDISAGRPIAPAPRLKPGTRLIREWHGVTHEVIVVEGGVLYRGERQRSLSVVARMITGSRWSGPRFFGLQSSEVMSGGT